VFQSDEGRPEPETSSNAWQILPCLDNGIANGCPFANSHSSRWCRRTASIDARHHCFRPWLSYCINCRLYSFSGCGIHGWCIDDGNRFKMLLSIGRLLTGRSLIKKPLTNVDVVNKVCVHPVLSAKKWTKYFYLLLNSNAKMKMFWYKDCIHSQSNTI
jgi:hypothetical protein